MSPSRRALALDGLRGIAAAGVVGHHVWQNTGHPVALLGEWWGHLALGVPFFFCLSGFLLYAPWVRAALHGDATPATGRYLVRRAARVLPAYYLALIGSVVLLHGTGHWRLVEDERLVWFAVFAQNLSGATAGRLDPPMWTLTVEVAFYAALPLLGWLVARLGRGRGRQLAGIALIAAAGIAWIAILQPDGEPREIRRTLPALLPIFACGMAARVLVEDRRIAPWTARALLAGGMALVAVHALHPLQGTPGNLLRDVPAAIGFAAICVACSTAAAPRVLTSWPIRTLGVLSFGIYLWHFPIMLALQARGLWPDDDMLAGLALVVPLSVAAAWMSWRLVERPVLERIRSRRDGSTPPDPSQHRVAGRRAGDELGDAAALRRGRLAHAR